MYPLYIRGDYWLGEVYLKVSYPKVGYSRSLKGWSIGSGFLVRSVSSPHHLPTSFNDMAHSDPHCNVTTLPTSQDPSLNTSPIPVPLLGYSGPMGRLMSPSRSMSRGPAPGNQLAEPPKTPSAAEYLTHHFLCTNKTQKNNKR